MPPTIIATCKQTRFHILDQASKEVDVEGITIAVSSPQTAESSTADIKSKRKAKAEARELISDAHLRLKAGVHYGLVGRNGTGKSTLLRAIADKLVPGIPHATRLAILQQTDADLENGDNGPGATEGEGDKRLDLPVLEYVLAGDEYKNGVVRKIDILSKSFESDDPLQPVKAIRAVRHDEAERELFLARKMASLRSGARGLQARKDLKAAEARLEASGEVMNQTKELTNAETIQKDTQAAMDALQELQSKLEAMTLVDTEQQARHILSGLGFHESILRMPVSQLSGGWRMRCMLASVLIQSPDIMILDEPTNYLDLLGIIWLENYLQGLRDSSQTTILMVSHDRDFVNAVSEEIIILRDQKLTYFRGNLSAYERDVEEQKLRFGRMKEAQERQTAHMEATIRENIKIGKKTGDENKLRQAKSRQKKVDNRMGIQVNANGGRFKLNRDLVGYHFTARAEIEVPVDERKPSIVLPPATELRFPGPLVSMEGVGFRYSKQQATVLDGVELVIHMGERVGIMGLNGCGKSTLIRLLTGSSVPTHGKISTHPRLKLGYYAQHSIEELQEQGRSKLDMTALTLMASEVNGALNDGEIRGLLATLGLQGRVVSDIPVCRLSGGQLVRLALARVVWTRPHLLILDEVTTHLDFDTVTALSAALSIFDGAILLVSHDRYMVRSVIEGKRSVEEGRDEGLEEDKGSDALSSQRRVVYVLKSGKLREQEEGVIQYERSLAKAVRRMLPTMG
ncbi:ABC-F family ATP-binding cassette domain-containing protein [Aspergillus homomorphus CBS 101889]|uniref:Putative ABC transporter n=1 Tax=Aspergillus homomorphus (strain CBS 101889) TaxID=1450537 RepID=A0A395IA57_ASPHC|nr:putative ABC transporter [Aspergillus homomorphus CBS 101889]RAL16916.1 putative ABC transporter [Aspergillus homomorphus CBS 101889]